MCVSDIGTLCCKYIILRNGIDHIRFLCRGACTPSLSIQKSQEHESLLRQRLRPLHHPGQESRHHRLRLPGPRSGLQPEGLRCRRHHRSAQRLRDRGQGRSSRPESDRRRQRRCRCRSGHDPDPGRVPGPAVQERDRAEHQAGRYPGVRSRFLRAVQPG